MRAVTLREITHDGDVKGVLLTECPCGYQFDEQEERSTHISNHNPEDFGLSPMYSGQQSLASFEDDVEGVMPDGGT